MTIHFVQSVDEVLLLALHAPKASVDRKSGRRPQPGVQ